MGRRARRTGAGRRDADAAWKGVLQALFPDFLAFAHADLHAAIDWTRRPEFRDQELQAVARRAATGHRRVDLLVQVWLRDGREQWLLIHVEVQAQPQEGFAERMFLYYALLFLRHRHPVVSLAVLIDGRDDWRPAEYAQDRWGCALHFHYPVLKLLDWRGREEELARLGNPFAEVALAQLAVLAAGRRIEPLAVAQGAILRRLLRAGYGEARSMAVLTFLDWVFGLPDDRAAQIDAEIAAEEGTTMTRLVSRWERLTREYALAEGQERGLAEGQERGLAEGQERGQRDLLLRQLERRFGSLEEETRARVGSLSGEQLVALGEAIFDFAAPADLERWLAAHADTTP